MEGTKGCKELEHIFLLMVIGRGAEKAQVLLHAPAMFFLPMATGVYVGHEQGLSLDLRPDSTTHELFPSAGPSTRLSPAASALNADPDRTLPAHHHCESAALHEAGRPRIPTVYE